MKVKLKEICNIEKGKQIDTSKLNDKNAFKYINGGIKESGFYTEYNTDGETVLVSEGGASCGFVNYVNEKFWCGCHCYKLTNFIKSNPKYIYYVLKGNQEKIMALRTGAAMPNIKKSTFQDMKVKINDDLDLQQKIVAKLDTIQAAIDNKQQQLKELDELVKSRFIEMFGENPVESGKWNVEKWADKVNITNGKDYKKLIVKTGLYPVYGSGGDMGIRVDDYLCTENTVIIGRKGNIDKPLFVKEKFWNVDTAFGLNVNENEINPYYFFEYCKTYDFRAMDTGVTIPSLTKNALFQLKIAVPPLSLQNSFADFVQQIDKSKFVVKQQIKDLQELMDSKMQEYFGE